MISQVHATVGIPAPTLAASARSSEQGDVVYPMPSDTARDAHLGLAPSPAMT
jgi:hypothetical protein